MRSGPFGPLRLSSVRILICTRAVRGTLLEGFPRQLGGVDERSAAGDGGFRERGRGAGVGGRHTCLQLCQGWRGLSGGSCACWMLLSFCQGPRRLEGPCVKGVGPSAG